MIFKEAPELDPTVDDVPPPASPELDDQANERTIEVEDHTDEAVLQELLAAIHARQWVERRRARGMLPD